MTSHLPVRGPSLILRERKGTEFANRNFGTSAADAAATQYRISSVGMGRGLCPALAASERVCGSVLKNLVKKCVGILGKDPPSDLRAVLSSNPALQSQPKNPSPSRFQFVCAADSKTSEPEAKPTIMDNRPTKQVTGCVASFLATGLLAFSAAHAETVVQTATDTGTGWNSDAVWGSATTAGNDYVTMVFSNNDPSRVGTPTVKGRVRGITGQETFNGDSLEIVPETELLIKNTGTYVANITLNGGLIRHSPNVAVNATLAGTINVAADSVLGSVQSAVQVFTVASTITGSATLRLAGGTGANQTITFDDGTGTSLNGFAGTLEIGGGETNAGGANPVTVDFNQPYVMSEAAVVMGQLATADILNLDANISVKSFAFNGTGLGIGTYDVATLNTTFGNGLQFTGTGTLTVTVGPPVNVRVVGTNVTTGGGGQVAQVQVTFSGLDTSKTYALKRGTDLVTFPDTVDTHQPASDSETFTDSNPLPTATSGKAFYILEDAP